MKKQSSVVWGISIGAAIGYGASWAMDQATGWYLERQSETSKRREQEVAPGGAPVLAGRKLAGWMGREITDEEAARIGFVVHRSLGVAYGKRLPRLPGRAPHRCERGSRRGRRHSCWWTRASSARSSPRLHGLIRWRATCEGL